VVTVAGVLEAGKYVHWGVLNVSVTNLAIIAVIIVVFLLAILLPFPHGADDDVEEGVGVRRDEERSS